MSLARLGLLVLLLITLWDCKKASLAPSPTGSSVEASAPQFPWPPPRASATADLSCQRLIAPGTAKPHLRDIDQRLSGALDASGYNEKSYYSVPDGFAMVTQLEQIESDGTPKPLPDRWSADVGPLQEFSLSRYLRALFTANPGFYRIIVFIVTPHPFSQDKREVQRSEAMDWLADGLNKLPAAIGDRELSELYSCKALVYEFEQPQPKMPATLKQPGRLSGRTHLEKTNLWNALERSR